VPQYPTVSGTQTTVSSSNTFPDKVGWLPASIAYIRANSPLNSNTPIITNFPCGEQTNQVLGGGVDTERCFVAGREESAGDVSSGECTGDGDCRKHEPLHLPALPSGD